ncbi:hypothetical protein [Fangia hongkongensis]|uniref:hypothetical protein n=1 Tax=Fangia hongkongensis TaxID=270495 RepID=UPI00036CDA79|nr:hypothetical protein [Fangia hongkongensis]MBK2126281.1 hypothetical protein [Fangia hongkongensis]
MKKKIILGLAGLLISSSAFAGFQLISNVSSINAKTTVVSCGGGNPIPAIFNQNVQWGVVKMIFLGGKSSATCTFTYTPSNTVIGTGMLTIANDLHSGTVTNITSGANYKVDVSGNGTENVNLTLSSK